MTARPDLRSWDAWHQIHQVFELDWWRNALARGHYADDAAFEAQWARVREFIKPEGRILDIGCGPRPPFAPCAVIEPLADEYRAITSTIWWDEVEAYTRPAEKTLIELEGLFDTIICWNALDHTIGWKDILDNMLAYGALGARFAIATDFFPPFAGHPGFPRGAFMNEIDKRFQIIDRREPFGRQLALLMVAK